MPTTVSARAEFASPIRKAHRLAIFLGLGLLLTALTFAAPPLYAAYSLTGIVPAMLLTGIVAMLATSVAANVPESAGLVIVIAVAVMTRIITIQHEPLLSTDIYRYIWDGRVQAQGLNPYQYLPADPLLAYLRDSVIYPLINRADYARTPYPPIAELFFFLVTRAGESTLVMRLGFIGCELAIVAVLYDLLRMFGRPRTLIVAYAWHPLAIWEAANSGHVDTLTAMLIMVAVWLLAHERSSSGAIVVALAALSKPYAVVLLPAFWRPWDWRLPFLVVASAVICYLPFLAAGVNVVGFLPLYLQEEGFQAGSGFWLVRIVRFAIGDLPALLAAYVVIAIGVLGWISLRILRRTDNTISQQRVRDAFVLLAAGLFFISPNYAWYYLALVPFIPLGGGRPAWAITLGAILLNVSWPDPDTRFLIWKSLMNAIFLVSILSEAVPSRAPAETEAKQG